MLSAASTGRLVPDDRCDSAGWPGNLVVVMAVRIPFGAGVQRTHAVGLSRLALRRGKSLSFESVVM